MKTNHSVFYVGLLIATFITFVACSNDSESLYNEPQEISLSPSRNLQGNLSIDDIFQLDSDYIALYNQINNLSNEADCAPQSFRTWLRKALNVIIADASGALTGAKEAGLTGAICNAITESGAAIAKNFLDNDEQGGTVDNQTVETLFHNSHYASNIALSNLIMDTQNPQACDSMGYIHNFVLLNTTFNHPQFNHPQQIIHFNDIVKHFYCSADTITGIPYSDLCIAFHNDSTAQRIVTNKLYQNNSFTTNGYFQQIIRAFPEYNQQLTILKTFIIRLEQRGSLTPKSFYISASQTVKDSTIAQEDKEAICMAISVAYASSKLWNFEGEGNSTY